MPKYTTTKFKLMTAFLTRSPIQFIVIGDAYQTVDFRFLNKIEHESGSTHSYNITGFLMSSGEEFTMNVGTID